MSQHEYPDARAETRAITAPTSDWIISAALLTGFMAAPAAAKPLPLPAIKRFIDIGSAPAPLGAQAYCAAKPDQCGARRGDVGDQRVGRQSPQHFGAPMGGIASRSASEQSPEDLFRLLLAAAGTQLRTDDGDGRKSATGGDAESETPRITLTPELWTQLRSVQRRINAAIQPDTGRNIYGQKEVWARPIADGAGASAPRGDCEDYVLEKRAALLKLGWPPDSLSIMTAMAPRVGMHAVLVVSTDQGDYVLDNLEARPRLAADLSYSWISRQRGLDMLTWRGVTLRSEAGATTADATARFTQLMRELIRKKRGEDHAIEAQ